MGRKGKREPYAEGIFKDGSGLAVIARSNGRQKEKRFPFDTPMKTMRDWQKAMIRELDKLSPVTPNTLAGDIARYVKDKITIASKADRIREIEAWLSTPLAGRRRSSITPREIDGQLRAWRQTLSASSVNHRRSALSDLFIALDGEEAHNPVKGCVWFKPPARVSKAIDRGRILRTLERLHPGKKLRWRLLMIHWTGMRPSQMGRLRPTGEDFYIDDRAFTLTIDGEPRRVPAILVPPGKGGVQVMLPLTPEAEEVARAFIRVKAFGKWSCQSANTHLKNAAKAAGEAPFHVYQIKHSFASALRRVRTDVVDIKDMLGHADIASTQIYAPMVEAKHVEALDRLRADDSAGAMKRAIDTRRSGAAKVVPESVSVVENTEGLEKVS